MHFLHFKKSNLTVNKTIYYHYVGLLQESKVGLTCETNQCNSIYEQTNKIEINIEMLKNSDNI